MSRRAHAHLRGNGARLLCRAGGREGAIGAKTGAVTVVQRTSSDLRLNPQLHAVFLDGAWHEQGGDLAWLGLGHLQSSGVGDVLEDAVTASRGTFVAVA